MKVSEWLAQLSTRLEPYKDFDIDEDWDEQPGKAPEAYDIFSDPPADTRPPHLYRVLQDAMDDTDLIIRYLWDDNV